ncbi:DUF4145 domain-containing protein [Arthrobacter psychrolactophilus]
MTFQNASHVFMEPERFGFDVYTEAAFECDHCSGMSIGGEGFEYHEANANSFEMTKKFWDRNNASTWYPTYIRGQNYPDVPDHIGKHASEAHKTFSIGAVSSSVLMARAVIEATAKDKGIDGRDLATKIVGLQKAGLIGSQTEQLAHNIRGFGNDMAHGDFTEPLDADDAETVLEFMNVIIEEVFQRPTKLASMQAKETQRTQARKAKQQTS